MIGRRQMLVALAAGWAGMAHARPGDRPAARALDGLWTHSAYTELERPKELSHLVLTPAEAEAYEAPRRALNGMPPSKPGDVGQAESEFTERGDRLARIRGEIRSSWIIDPPDGRIPYTAAAIASLGLDKPPVERFDNPEDRSNNERCLASFAAGAPMLPGPDTNYFKFVQTPDTLAILSEKYHDVRIVRLTAGSRPRNLPPSWMGDSVGRWEGDTLVVETEGLRPGVTGRGQRLFESGATRVIERLTRTGPAEILYAFRVEDADLFTRPWRGELVFRPAQGQLFEYACHEGNYAVASVLSAARQADAAAAAGRP
ncbi:hypothetical protein [Phenylobacterium sp.]|uniref:hypothetical protein n=1 Tax=Phenylobacterium sp. TaxID=1871053 RepID=UPI0025F48675|nr:hypothetical protein [Phenylobacterium sp.]